LIELRLRLVILIIYQLNNFIQKSAREAGGTLVEKRIQTLTARAAGGILVEKKMQIMFSPRSGRHLGSIFQRFIILFDRIEIETCHYNC